MNWHEQKHVSKHELNKHVLIVIMIVFNINRIGFSRLQIKIITN